MSEHEDEIRAKCAYLIDSKIIKSPATKEDLICEMYELSLYRDAYLKLREAVELYGDKGNWRKNSGDYFIENLKGSFTTITFNDHESRKTREGYNQHIGGKRARLAIKAADEMLKEKI